MSGPYAGLLSYCTLLLGRKSIATGHCEYWGSDWQISERRECAAAGEQVKVDLVFSINASHVEEYRVV